MNDENIIIKTKLNIPGISKNFVARKNIEQKLKYITDYKLTILTAPAGYGKTTTAASILSKSGLLIAWFSLDNEDNDPVRFWNYILAALAEKISSLKVGFDDLSVNRELIESNILAGLIINQLDLLQNKMVLVLDDFHFITNEIIDRSLAYFVQHMPDNFSLIILSRREIDLKLTNMYSKQQVMKLDGSELAFNMDEIEKFYRQRGTRLSLEEVSLMQNYTEGWAAGLVLASLAMEGQKDIHGLSRRFLGSMQIDRLLDEEVFDHWPDEIKDFLVCASFLERFSASLCQAVTGLKDCADILRKLSESNSFIIPLDQQGEWYRYHHLFAEYLQKRLAEKGREYSLSLYRNAGQWYWDNGFKNEAVDAFIKGEDFKKALDLYWHVYIEMSRKGQIPTMLKWLGSIPAKYHKNGPAFCFTYAYLLTMDNQLEAAQKWAARGVASFYADNGYVEDIVSREYIQKLVSLVRADTAIRSRDARGAVACYAEAQRSKYTGLITVGEMNPGQISILKTVWGFFGRLNLIKEAYLAPGVDLPLLIGNNSAYLTVVLIEVLYERNELSECREALVNGLEDVFKLNSGGVIVPYFITLAKLKWAEGDISGAFMAICEGEKKLGDGNAYWHYLFDLYTTALYLDMNDIKTARTRLNLTRTGIYDHLSHAREVEHIILAQYLLKSGNLDEAVLLLTRLKNLAEKEDRLGSEVEILCLLALAYQRQGNREKALKALDKALELGMEDGYMRTFIDKVEPMANLLEAYLQGRENSAHTRHIYACQLLAQTQTGQNIKKAVSPTTIELTRRELRVLRLLAEERSNQDIARELNVSVRTVKYHNANLYKKLESKSRIEALIKAREAGLLE